MSNSTNNELFCPLLQEMRGHKPNISTEVNLVVVCIHGLVSCLGILENALVLWVVGFRLRHRTVASVWVLNLAMSDFLLGGPLCKIQASIFFLNMFVSAFLLAAISLDRLLLVVKPVWSQNHRSVAGAWKVCLLVWFWAAINTLPYTVFRSVTQKLYPGYLCYHNFALILSSQATLERDCKVRQAATAISKLLLAFIFPLMLIAGSYIQITNQGQLSQSFIKMVTFVIAAFALCWAPYHIFCMIEVTKGLPLATTIAFLNPVLNPILYAFSCPNFCVRIRQSLGAVFDGLVEGKGGS
uniref:Prostaglandin D2 receptor 2 n=1 Tax=Lates calcarifer TaxID=8187 RepID=A0A4W6EJC0_LATCA